MVNNEFREAANVVVWTDIEVDWSYPNVEIPATSMSMVSSMEIEDSER